MNAKQTVQIAPAIAGIAVVAPQIIVIAGIGCGIYFGLKWLLSDDKEAKPETSSSPSVSERPASRPPIPAGNSVQNSNIPANSGGKINNPPISASIPAIPPKPPASVSTTVSVMSVPVTPKIPVQPQSAIPAVKIQPEIPRPAWNKIISRDDMAKIFSGGRGLTRKAAVSALKALGYGKTAAYQALEINGRFAPYLQFASDGIISWKMDGN